MLKLIVDVKRGEVQSATVPVRWCVDKATLDELKKMDVVEPYLLLVTVFGGREMSRQLAPLSQLMDFVALRHSGINTIYATIVFPVNKQKSESGYDALWRMFLKRKGGTYDTDLVGSDGKFIKEIVCWRKNTWNLEFAEVVVIVPGQFFAKEPAKWERRWVNLWFEDDRVRDQCQFRRRRILAYTIQPLAVLVWIIVRFLVGLGGMILFFGFFGDINKRLNLKPFIHPWSSSIAEVWDNSGKSLFNSVFLWPFSPLVFWTMLIFTIICIGLTKTSISFWEAIGIAAICQLSLISTYYFFMVLGAAILWIFGWTIDQVTDKLLFVDEKPQKVRQRVIENEGWLLCERDLTPSVEALPTQKRTVYLRYMDLKAKVCRPFPKW